MSEQSPPSSSSSSSSSAPAPPEITPEMRAGARANPSSWLYVVDPAFDEDAEIPPWGVVGAYPVDASGEITTPFRHNTGYRPSAVSPPVSPPVTPPVPAPVTDLERTLRLIASGHRNQAELPGVVLRATLLLYASAPDDRSITGFPARHGTVMVPACTSPASVPSAWPGWREITGAELVPLLYGHPLVLDPAGPVSAMIPAAHLTRASG
jgi:type III secretion system (T3SS) SseB-like protein